MLVVLAELTLRRAVVSVLFLLCGAHGAGPLCNASYVSPFWLGLLRDARWVGVERACEERIPSPNPCRVRAVAAVLVLLLCVEPFFQLVNSFPSPLRAQVSPSSSLPTGGAPTAGALDALDGCADEAEPVRRRLTPFCNPLCVPHNVIKHSSPSPFLRPSPDHAERPA